MLDFSVTFFFTFINIGILFFVLRAILFKPVSKFMDQRAAKIRNDIEGAERDREEAKKLLEEQEEVMVEARKEAGRVIKNARSQAEEQAERIIAGAKADAEALLKRSREDLEAERRNAMTLFRAQAAVLVMKASGRLLRRELSGEDRAREIADFLEEAEDTL
ncbi:MAG: F0F1 ATP synthase subunit B [Spirochaetaceae bacterium]|jgi:F-type H+-transporting ATPase subunit b|nr:F0F1 ATP synthase subunit B [Spirochaetaceae bacterium]